MKISWYVCLFWLLACNDPRDNVSGNISLDSDEKDTVSMDNSTAESSMDSLTYLALGDSYTVGESVTVDQRWPVQLRTRLIDVGVPMKLPRIIAKTGWTTDELQSAIDNADIDGETYDLVSLLIGVNNQYRGYPLEQYQEQFPALLQQAIDFAGGDASKVFVVSIPDYGVTPFGQSGDPEKIREEIDVYNGIAKSFADSLEVEYFDITPISRRADEEPNLVASDGLHPSGEMYRLWVELIYPRVREILDE